MQKYWWRQTEWHSKMDKSMQVNGMGESTREAYLRSMRMLVEHYDRMPDHITEDELLDYFIHRQNVTGWSPATMRICYSGVKFFFKHVLKRDWHLLTIAQARRERRLPAVLSRDEVKKVFSLVRPFHNYAYLATVYSCGLRLQEGLYLEVSDIDGPRKMIHVHRGKGAKDRYVPLPESTYDLLRRYWRTHRNPKLIFPAVGRGGQDGPTSTHNPHVHRRCTRRSQESKTRRQHQKEGRLRPHLAPLICHPPAGSRRQPPHHPKKSRSFQHRNHHGLPASDQ